MGTVRKILGVVILVCLGLLGAGPAPLPVRPAGVVVEDRAGVLDRSILHAWTHAIGFHQPTMVGVYTYNGTAAANLNEEVWRFAREERPEWISADGQKWADGFFLLALDTAGRQLGTFMGEDRKVSLEQRNDIQNVASELLRDARWTEGTVAGIKRAAQLINQPWYGSEAFLVTALATAAAATFTAATCLVLRWHTRAAGRRDPGCGDAG